jgi:methylmalonyl-CoA mutase N-terminal domain/subunit
MGGTIKAIEDGWFQREIADSAYETFLRKSSGERSVIGVNKYIEAAEHVDIELHPADLTAEQRQIEHLGRVKQQRDNERVQQLLEELKVVAQNESKNIMPVTIELVKAGASMGDIVETLKQLWGTYREVPVI